MGEENNNQRKVFFLFDNDLVRDNMLNRVKKTLNVVILFQIH